MRRRRQRRRRRRWRRRRAARPRPSRSTPRLPLQGASRPQTTALVNGIKLALEQAGGKAGDFTVKYESLDDSTAQAGSWTPEATQANASKAAQDDSTAVYIGEFNSGASAISIPILNEAGVPQISPANTAVGLTSDEPGSEPGRAGQVLPRRHADLHPHRPEGHDPGRRSGDGHEGGRLHQGPADQRQGGLRRGSREEHPELRPRPRAWRSSPTRRSTRTLRTTARWPRRPRAPVRTASSTRASPRTTRSSSTRTSRRRCRTRSSTGRTAWPSPGSPTPRRAASRPTWPPRSR